MNEKFEHLLVRAEQLIGRIEAVLPQPLSVPDWNAAIAYRYRKRNSGHGTLEPVRHVGMVRLACTLRQGQRRNGHRSAGS